MPSAGGHLKLCNCGCGRVLAPGQRCPRRAKEYDARRAKADAKRPSASARGYDNKWTKARATYLLSHPTCARCPAPAVMVDHVIRHDGDQRLFWDKNNWQGLCAFHHNVAKQSEEKRASAPVEQRRHPFLRKPRIPVTIVCGPAGAGKSTYVRDHAGPKDLVIDLDVIRSQLAGTPLYADRPDWIGRALDRRNELLASLATDTTHDRAWFIISAPAQADRDLWASKLGANVVLLATPLGECLARINADERRQGHRDRMAKYATDWWRSFQDDRRARP